MNIHNNQKMKTKEDSGQGLIHGLELQGRALSPVISDTDNITFLVGTQSLRHNNKIYRLVLDEETHQLVKKQFKHSAGEVWHLDSCPTDDKLFTSTYGEREGPNGWRKSASIMKIPDLETGVEDEQLESVETVTSLANVLGVEKQQQSELTAVMWQPNDSCKLLCLQADSAVMLDVGESEPKKILTSVHSVRGQTRLETGRWNPHRNYHQFATVTGCQVVGWDTRTGDQSWTLVNTVSNQSVRSVDFNPNKQYYLVTGCDEGCVSVWDVRSPDQALLTMRHHSHWVWSTRYNTYHDQLLLSAGSDSKVIMTSVASLSSEPYGALLDDDDGEVDGKTSLEDGVISVWSDHEDSVYTAEWSSADPWTWASLSYDGRLVIGHVPQTVKFNILNL